MSARRTIAGLLAGTLLAIAGLAACSRTTSAPSSAPGAGPARGEDAAQGGGGTAAEPPGAAPGAPAADGDANQAPSRVRLARSLIYTGSITIRVDNVVEAADRAVTIATGLGGIVGGDRRTLDEGRSEAQLVLRVPADKFSAALSELARQLGEEESRSVQTEDVTEAMIDLDTRLATQRASVERVRALLARARTIGEVVSIEGELTRREAELASLELRKERMADQVALSTITVILRGPEAPGEQPKEPDTGFIAGLKAGWKGFVTSVNVVLTVAGTLLPWLLAIGLPVWFVFWLLRRRRPAAIAVAPATATAPAPAAPSASDQSPAP
jgi:hypothetical protein